MKKPIKITGVWLHTNIKDHVTVAVEVDGQWVDIISEWCPYDGVISHICEPNGIRNCAEPGYILGLSGVPAPQKK